MARVPKKPTFTAKSAHACLNRLHPRVSDEAGEDEDEDMMCIGKVSLSAHEFSKEVLINAVRSEDMPGSATSS